MDKKTFWNEVARYGLLLGITMGGSKIFEQSLALSGNPNYAMWIILEWLFFAVLFFVLLYHATTKQADRIDPAQGFTFSQGLGYMILISIFAAIPVSCIFYLYIDIAVGGYDNYVAGLTNLLITSMKGQQVDSATASAIDMLIEQMRAQPKPSIFSILFSTMFQYATAGLFAGLFLAGRTSRKPQLTSNNNEE